MPKISELVASAAFKLTDLLPVVQDGVTKKATFGAVRESLFGANSVNILNYHNGGSDFTAARAAAITKAGKGGTVIYPRISGGYGYSAAFSPLERQRHVGEHSPMYDWDDTPDMENAQYALPGYSDPSNALMRIANPTIGRGSSFINQMWVGLGDTTGSLNAFDFGQNSGAERSIWVERCQFMQFGGAAFAGHMWVIDLLANHISRCGYGIRPASGYGNSSGANGNLCVAFDNRWVLNQIYFTYHHGIALDGGAESGAVTMDNNRVERAGTQVSGSTVTPIVNRDQNACGIYATRLAGFQIANTFTDANASQGLRLDGAVNKGSVRNGNMTGNIWKRDGTGNNTDSLLPGVYIRNVTNVHHVGDQVTWGDPDDNVNDSTTRRAPQYGVMHGDTDFWSWRGSVEIPTGTVDGFTYLSKTFANSYPTIPGSVASWRPVIDDGQYALVRSS